MGSRTQGDHSSPGSTLGYTVRYAIRFAVTYSICLVLATAISHGRNLTYFGRSLTIILVFYFASALFAGVVAGLLAPAATSRARAAVIGFVIALPVAWSIIKIFRPQYSAGVVISATLVSALIYGGGYGLILWRAPEERS